MSKTVSGQSSIVQYGRMAVPPTRYDSLISQLLAAVPSREAPDDFGVYLEKVRDRAYSITDEDVQELKEAGYSEDEIFEHTVSAAVAAGIERLNAGLRTLR
jgi:alkylhydroperoxidase family enzyme